MRNYGEFVYTSSDRVSHVFVTEKLPHADLFLFPFSLCSPSVPTNRSLILALLARRSRTQCTHLGVCTWPAPHTFPP